MEGHFQAKLPELLCEIALRLSEGSGRRERVASADQGEKMGAEPLDHSSSPDPKIIDVTSISSSGSCRGDHPRRPRSTHPPVGVTSSVGIARALCDGGGWYPIGSSPLSLRATGNPLATPPAGARRDQKVIFFGVGLARQNRGEDELRSSQEAVAQPAGRYGRAR